jgi:signal transduction histidine kinase
VIRHAKATEVQIRLRVTTGRVYLRVQDNGCGISRDSIHNPISIGLAGMRERAQVLGGNFDIRSRPGSGTAIRVWVPLQKGTGSPEGAS